ncbi:MAG: site-2 protease family protein [Oscillospiraceae bacterium]|nr:site-2 protease family protein [Oscillospiraceae bacterium]MDD6083927.1 site-2 protease family protein [Oscillospiraceae bacterium]
MNIIIALVMFGILVAIHEFGHFAVAKLSGIKVNKFAIGMGPVIFKFTKGETEYSLRLFPVGGYCAMEGEDESSDDSRAFRNKPVKNRIGVVIAGPVMNLILGFVLSFVTVGFFSDIIKTNTVREFYPNAMSEQTGLMAGDEIISMDGTRIFTTSDISYKFTNSKDGVFDLVVKRDGKKIKLNDVKFYREYYYYIEGPTDEIPYEHYVTFDTREEYTGDEKLEVAETNVDFKVFKEEKKTFINMVSYAVRDSLSTARLIWMSFIDLIRGKYGLNDLSGPVGIVTAIGTVRTYGMESLMNLIVMITINLGIFNLLPLPALDGGRLVFLIIEGIRKKPVPPEKEGMVHLIGMACFIILMGVITVSDILKLTGK